MVSRAIPIATAIRLKILTRSILAAGSGSGGSGADVGVVRLRDRPAVGRSRPSRPVTAYGLTAPKRRTRRW